MRYFIIPFTSEKDNESFSGEVPVTTEKFINRHDLVQQIKTILKVDNIIIINIIELTKKDFEEYLRK